jgi:hypothetical protein
VCCEGFQCGGSMFLEKTLSVFSVATHRHRPMSIGRFVWKNVWDSMRWDDVRVGQKVLNCTHSFYTSITSTIQYIL